MHKETVWAGACLFAIFFIGYSTIMPDSLVNLGTTATSSGNLGGFAYANGAIAETSTAEQPLQIVSLRLNSGSIVSGQTITVDSMFHYTRADAPSDANVQFLVIEAPGTEYARTTSFEVAYVYTKSYVPTHGSVTIPSTQTKDSIAYATIDATALQNIIRTNGQGWYRVHVRAANSLGTKESDVYLFLVLKK